MSRCCMADLAGVNKLPSRATARPGASGGMSDNPKMTRTCMHSNIQIHFLHLLQLHKKPSPRTMDTDIHPLIEDLTSNIDDLEESLAPLLNSALSHSTSKLPLLDKAKAYVLATYAIESLLFSSLRLNGVDAKSHAVFKELARVKEYFGKIKSAETAGTKRSTTLNKEAANRFVKHGLAGNGRYDRERAQRGASERTGAKRNLDQMATGTHTKFDEPAKRSRADTDGKDAVVVDLASSDDVSKDAAKDGEEDDDVEEVAGKRARPAPKSSKDALASLLDNADSMSDQPPGKKKKKKKRMKPKMKDMEDRRAAEMM